MIAKYFFGLIFLISWPFLTGCQTMNGNIIPSKEFEAFTPLPAEKRIMNNVRVKWEVRDDVVEYCAKASRMTKDQAYMTPPIACAVWNKPVNECTIVTGKTVLHVALGHELRHCFEGHFH